MFQKTIYYFYVLIILFLFMVACVMLPTALTKATPSPEPTFDKNTYVYQPEITLNDNGRTIIYIYGPRFDLMLDDEKYPLKELRIECEPKPLLGYISNGSCYPDCYPIRFEAEGSPGTCDLTDRDFHVHIRFY